MSAHITNQPGVLVLGGPWSGRHVDDTGEATLIIVHSTGFGAPLDGPALTKSVYRLATLGISGTVLRVYVPEEWAADQIWWNVLAGYAALSRLATTDR